jgi:conjugative transfer region protein TrbK
MTRPLKIAAVAWVLGFAAAAIVAATLAPRRESDGVSAPVDTLSAAPNPLARELARCQAIGPAAQDDAGCAAAWAENRRRFFTVEPASKSEEN